MVEIYNETVRDLLAEQPGNKPKGWAPPALELRQGEHGVYVQGQTARTTIHGSAAPQDSSSLTDQPVFWSAFPFP